MPATRLFVVAAGISQASTMHDLYDHQTFPTSNFLPSPLGVLRKVGSIPVADLVTEMP